MRFFDGLFNKNPIWTLLMSGSIGIAIYAISVGDQFEDQNKFVYIAIGFPIWFIVRHVYWRKRIKSLEKEIGRYIDPLDRDK